MRFSYSVAIVIFCLVLPVVLVRGDNVFPVDDGSVSVKEFQFPGPIQQFWWVSGLEIVVRANGHLFLQRNYGSSGDWEDVTRGLDDFNVSNPRVPGMGSVSNIRFPPKPAGVSQDILLVETLQSKTFIVTIEVPGTPMVVGAIALDRVPSSWTVEVSTTTTTTAASGGGVATSVSGVFSDVQFHPTIPSVAVAILRNPDCRGRSLSCASAAYVTSVEITDLPFLQWSLVESDKSIMQAFFGSPSASGFSSDAFFVLTKPTESGVLLDGQMFQLSLSAIAKAAATSTTSFVNPSLTSPILSSTFGAETLGKFTVVAAATDEHKIGLFITDNNFLTTPTHANFGTHIFPSDIHPYDEELDERETGYTLLSVTDEIFVNVYRASAGSTQTWGHTYVSGQSGHRFSLSLPYNRRLDRWNAAVDFHQVAGIEGVILANVVQNPDDESCRNCGTEEECDQECAFGTVISHDNGKSWQTVPPPAGACKDTAVSSSSGASCSLHLHSYSSSRMFNTHPVVSSKSAPGLIVATGNVGDFLDLRTEGMADANVYMSRDAGRSWVLVKRGPAIYGETDYGGVLYLLPSDRQARHLNFSVDEGATWSSAPVALPGKQYVFSSLLVPDALPNAHFLNVLAFMGNGGRNDVAIHIDFSSLKQRTCANVDAPNDPSSDFELFQPTGFFAASDGTSCFLGRSVSYARKKYGAKCWVDVPPAADGSTVPNFLLPKVSSNCSCTKDDYECDVDYIESGENCVPLVEAALARQDTVAVSTPTADIPVVRTPAESLCDSGQLVAVTTGYRKLGGDSCVGGLDLNPTTVPCPPSQQSHVAGYLALIALAASGVLLLIWQRAQADPEFAATVATVCFPLRCLFRGSASQHASGANRYSSVRQEEGEADVDDNADDESTHETAALRPAREAAAPTRRVAAASDEAGEELRDAAPVVSAFSCPVTVKAHDDDAVLPTPVAAATVESPSTFFDAFSSLEPPPLPSVASSSGAPRAAPSSSPARTGTLDFIDFGQ